MQLRCFALTESEYDQLSELLQEVHAETEFAFDAGAGTGKLRRRRRNVPVLIRAIGVHWIQDVKVEEL